MAKTWHLSPPEVGLALTCPLGPLISLGPTKERWPQITFSRPEHAILPLQSLPMAQTRQLGPGQLPLGKGVPRCLDGTHRGPRNIRIPANEGSKRLMVPDEDTR